MGAPDDPQAVLRRLHRAMNEHDVLAAMAEGLSNPAIAHRLRLSLRAVEKHVTNIFDKLGLTPTGDSDRRVLAVLRYLG